MRELSLVLAGLALACPLVAVPGAGFDSFRLPFVLVLAAALLGCAFVRSSRGGDRPPGPYPLRTAAFLLLGAHGLSLPAARSIADAASPILTLAAGVAVYSCVRGGLLRRERALLLLPVIPAVALAFGGVAGWQVSRNIEAVATEGNRNYAGALAAMLLPASIAMVTVWKGWRRGLGVLGGAAALYVLLVSESRGGFLAALAGLVLTGVAAAVRKVPRGGVVAAVAALVLLVSFAGGQGRDQLSERRLDTVVFRLEAWKSGLSMVLQRPVTGWGAGGFSTEYPPFRSEKEFHVSHGDGKEGYKEVEDPHSSWVSTAVETGVVGLLALLLVVYVAARLWRYYVRHASDPETAAALAGLGGGALAYLVAGGFNTLTIHVSHTMLFWGFLALIEVLGETRDWRPGSRVKEVRAAIPAAAAIALLFGAFWTARLGMSDQAFTKAMTANEATLREKLLRDSIDLSPGAWRSRYELARVLTLRELHQGALEQTRTVLQRRPYHVEALNLAAASILRSGGDGPEAERLFREAIRVAPWYYKSYFNLALLQAQRGQRAESRALLTQSLSHKPDHGASYYYRGLAGLIEGDAGAALADFRMARGQGYRVGVALKADHPASATDPRFEELFR